MLGLFLVSHKSQTGFCVLLKTANQNFHYYDFKIYFIRGETVQLCVFLHFGL